MRFVVVGAGAVGGVVGARLSRAGHEVVLVARGPHLDAIRADGLRVESAEGTQVVRIPAAGSPAEVDWRPDDVALLAVKSHQSADALADLAAEAPAGLPVACLQNGIANERMALRHFPVVQGVMVACPTGFLQPGVVQAWSSPTTGLLDVGRWPAGADELSESLVAAFASASFDSRVTPDVARWKNRKLLMSLGNAIDAVCGPPERDGELHAMVTAEGEAALAAAGMAVATGAEDTERRGDLLQLGEIAGGRHPGSSSWQSLRRGTGGIESDFLNGEVVLLGRMHGVPTPANALLQRLARELATGRRPPASVPVDDVMRRLAAAR